MRAAALNFRDLAIVTGRYFGGPAARDLVALSDGAGEVVAVGAGVTRFKVGDRVAGTFFRNYIDGPPVAIGPALGSPADGVLAEFVVFNQNDAVRIPKNLSFAESRDAAVRGCHRMACADGCGPSGPKPAIPCSCLAQAAFRCWRCNWRRQPVRASSRPRRMRTRK